jgi:nucleoside 2-deoxyribosyltransferase
MENGLVVITGGLQQRLDDPTALTADRMVIEGMLSVLHARAVAPEEHIETVLPDVRRDSNKLIRFKEGRIRMLEKRNAQSRRFSMVHSSDVVVSVEGEHGTRSVLDVALAIERPVLPLPFGGGASKEVWQAQREDIINWFQISGTEVESFEQTKLAELNEPQVRELAKRVHAYLMRGFTQGCFVIMRFHERSDPVFDEAIRPALAAHGFQAWRTDRSVPTGDVIAAIRDGINHCYFVIADTTEDRPNVMYELGLAHASNKPVILLRRANPDGSLPPAPFDFQTQSILCYTDDLNDLRRRLETAIGILSGKIHHASGL